MNPYLKKEKKHFLYTFKRQPLLIKKAKGAFVWDEKGKKYLDFYSGLAVCGVGHNNTHVVKAIKSQAAALLHTSNFFYTKPQMNLAKALTARLKGSRVFFSNSGAEANECAIKLARLWATKNKKKGREIITFRNSFHGRTLATTAASSWGRAASQTFKPLPAGFKSVPYNDFAKLKKAVSSKTIAIMVEPIQGEGGIHVASKPFLKGMAALCRKKNILLIADEIQSGLGRTGSFFAMENYGIKPDIVTLAKGLAGGLPLGATLATTKISSHVVPGLHGSTFGGNPVACNAALEVLKLLSLQGLQRIRSTGRILSQALSLFKKYPSVTTIRGRGLMVGIELNSDGAPYVALARKKGLLINCTQQKVLRFLPPYFISKKDLLSAVRVLHDVFKTMTKD